MIIFFYSDLYGLKVSDVQLPDTLEDTPYIIIKPKNYVSCVCCDLMFRSCDLTSDHVTFHYLTRRISWFMLVLQMYLLNLIYCLVC